MHKRNYYLITLNELKLYICFGFSKTADLDLHGTYRTTVFGIQKLINQNLYFGRLGINLRKLNKMSLLRASITFAADAVKTARDRENCIRLVLQSRNFPIIMLVVCLQ